MSVEMKADRPVVTIGEIVSTHGLHGELKVRSYSDVPGRFESLKQVMVVTSQTEETFQVRRTRVVLNGVLLELAGVDTYEAAARLTGAELQIPQEPLPPRDDGQYYECDLIGMAVDTDEGKSVGMLTDVIRTSSNAVFVVEAPDRVEHLIPGTREIVKVIDTLNKRMVIHPISGLLEEKVVDAV